MATHSMKGIARACILALAVVGAAPACTGRIDDPVGTRPRDRNGAGSVGAAGAGSVGAAGAGSVGAAGAGSVGAGGTGTTPPGGPASLTGARAFGRQAARRLSHSEYRRAVEDALGITLGTDADSLPSDPGEPFDNEYRRQFASAAWIEGSKSVADKIAAKVVADDATRIRLSGCAPTGPTDAKCLTQFVNNVGRRLLRRPLLAEEVTELLRFQSFAQTDGNFWTSAAMALRTLLQDLEFLYRIEIGAPVAGEAGLFKLNDYEVGARLSFLLWGSGPDDGLLDSAAQGRLQTSTQLRDAATAMLQSPKALRQLQNFHAAWFGYESLPHPEVLSGALVAETNALIQRVVLDERRSWLDLFTATETWISSAMHGALYGLSMPASGQPGWVSYGATGRKGILSHGSVLSNGTKATDTSPTLRGVFIRMRVMCQEVPPPPPNVNNALPPSDAATPCKADRYTAHRTDPSCSSCHSLLDPIGFGLENYDSAGRYRTQEPNTSNCPISGRGDVPGLGPFRGPAELTDLLLKGGRLDRCLSIHLYQFAMGRPADSGDETTPDALLAQFIRSGYRVDQLLLDLVTAPAFQHRWVE
jgi:hypothetical protein